MIISLKKYINNWLDTYKVKDIFTGEIQSAREIFNWDKSYFLKLLIQDKYYIDTDIDFATKNPNYIKIIKKPLSQISPKKVKKYRKVGTERKQVGTTTEKRDNYVPITKWKYHLIDDYNRPKFNTVIKRRKIGRTFYITTEYIPTGKYHKKREYYEDVIGYKNKPIIIDVPIYETVDIFEPYYEQERTRTEQDITTQVEEHRFYEPFFVFDYYKKLNETDYEHYLYIAPFFDGYGASIKIGSDDDDIVGHRRLPKFISPKELTQTHMFKTAFKQCRFIMVQGKQNLYKKYFREINERITNDELLHTINLLDSNKYSLDMIKAGLDGIIFFKSSDIAGNTKTVRI